MQAVSQTQKTAGQRRWNCETYGQMLAAWENFKDSQEEYGAQLDIEAWRRQREANRSPWVRPLAKGRCLA